MWAHKLRNVRHMLKKDWIAPEVVMLYEYLKWIFGEGKHLAKVGILPDGGVPWVT